LKDKAKLSNIPLYHVVSGKVLSTNLKYEVIKAENDDNVRVRVIKRVSRVLINNVACITKADVQAKNGVIHFINDILLPTGTLLKTIQGEERLSTLAATIKAAGLESTMKNAKTDLTIFAPTNQAFFLEKMQ
jgi:transforming growth factor-beta-induced protein